MAITTPGDGYLRRLLVAGATAVLRHARQSNPSRVWALRLLDSERLKVVAVAIANKTACIAWVLMAKE